MEHARIRRRIEEALRDEDESTRRDIAFHMTDWLPDLRDLVRLYESPDEVADDEVAALLMRFLVHVPAHVAAAAKLYTGEPVKDVFGVGAVASSPRGSEVEE